MHYVRVDGKIICLICNKPYNKHPRILLYDDFNDEEISFVKACNGILYKT